MHVWKWTRRSLTTLATIGLLLPTPCVFGQSPTPENQSKPTTTTEQESHPAPVVTTDVALDEGNVLRGVVVDNAGQRAADIHVLLFHHQKLVATGQSNKEGEFAIANLRGGFYQIAAGERVVSVRCWTADSAPPKAVASTLIQISDIQRGQVHPATCALANPWVIAGFAAAAIIVPVSLKVNRDDRPLGSG
ncbi:MAG: hypothetical protein AAF497_05070 [Planctomycetota bacterium]